MSGRRSADDEAEWLAEGEEVEPGLLVFLRRDRPPDALREIALAACRAGVRGLVLDTPGLADDLEALRAHCHAAGVALLMGERAAIGRAAAVDGAHLESVATIAALRQALGPHRLIGGSCGRSRDAAMEAGEAGADYVLFGDPGSADGDAEEIADLVAWWSELFVLPCAGSAGTTPEVARDLVRSGAAFVAFADTLFGDDTACLEAIERFRAAICD